MSNIQEHEEQAKNTGHRALKFPMSIPKYDKDLLEVFNLLEKGERSFFARSMIRKGLQYCIENGIDIFENTTLSRGNPLLTQQAQQQSQQNEVTASVVADKVDVQHGSVSTRESEQSKNSPQIIRTGSSNMSSVDEGFDVENALFQQKK